MKRGLSIVEFVTGADYLGDHSLSTPQLAILKAVYGLAMTPEELAAFRAMSGGQAPKRGGYDEVSLGCGRRSGKTEKIAANIAAYEAVGFDADAAGLAPGETAYVLMVAQNKKQAGICRDYVEAKFQVLTDKGWDVFADMPAQERAITAQGIKLRNRVQVVVVMCSKVAVRGLTCVCAVLDELGHWQTEADAYNADTAVLRAIRPTQATLKRKKLVKISTPGPQGGVFYDDWKRRHRTTQLVLHEIPTAYMNPTVSAQFLADEQLADPEGFPVEYLAKWASGGGTYLTGDLVDSCTDTDRVRVAPKAGVHYMARIDSAFKRDLFVVGVGHEAGGVAIIDLLRYWKPGGPKHPLDFHQVVADVVGELRPYGVDAVAGDQFADVPLKDELAKAGLTFVMQPLTLPAKYEQYKNLRAVMQAKRCRLPDDKMVRRDLTGLVAKRAANGLWRIAAPPVQGFTDDISIVVAGLVHDLLDLTQLDLVELNRDAMPRHDPERGKWGKGEKDWADDIMGAVL